MGPARMVWRDNPEGLFAESHPRVTCSVEE